MTAVVRLEQPEQRSRVLGDFPLREREDIEGHNYKHDEVDHDGRIPGIRDTAIAKTEEEQDDGTHAGDGAEPIHGQQTLKEEEYENGSEAGYGGIDPETPSPGDELGEGPYDRPGAACYTPGYVEDAVVVAAVTD